MRNSSIGKLLLLTFFSGFLTISYADDLVFDSFEEAQKAAEKRSEEYDRRMAEHNAQVNGAWEKQKGDLGDNANLDISKITDTRTTEQTSENAENKKLQDSITNSINDMKQQMINAATANTPGFAGASAGYSWRVEYSNGKYILSDTYDEAMFVSGASGSNITKTTSGGKKAENKDTEDPTNPTNPDNNSNPDYNNNYPSEPNSIPDSDVTPESNGEDNPSNPENLPDNNQMAMIPSGGDSPTVNSADLEKADRVVEIRIQHPATFEEATYSVTEGAEAKVLKLDKFTIPEDTRVKIYAKANMEVENTTLTMTIIDNEGEGDPIDSTSMKNYRHIFRIPSMDKYSVNIYVNETGKQPKKIMQLQIPVTAVDFDSRTISR